MPIFLLNRYFFQLFSYMSSKNISIKMSMNLLWTRASKEHESEIMTDRKTIQPTSIRFTGKVTTFPIITSLSTFQLSCWTQLSPVQRCSRCSCCAGTFSPRICTGCSLDIVFFFSKILEYLFRTVVSLRSPRCQCMYVHNGRSNTRTAAELAELKKSQHFKEKHNI